MSGKNKLILIAVCIATSIIAAIWLGYFLIKNNVV